MTRSDDEYEEQVEAEVDEGLFQFRDFQLLHSVRIESDGRKTHIPGVRKIIREPFALLAAAEFHRLVRESNVHDDDEQWTHCIAELSLGKPSKKVLQYHVTKTHGWRLDCTPLGQKS